MTARRQFIAGSAALAASLLSPAVRAVEPEPIEGVHYVRIDPPAPVGIAAPTIEVVEFFSYGCTHCFALDPTVSQWARTLPSDVRFVRVPVAFRDDFVPQQRLYYALESLGLLDSLHEKVFAAIHRERLALARGTAIESWVAAQGVDAQVFAKHFHSFDVATRASQAYQLQMAYRVEGVPSLGVAGRFYTDGQLARSNVRMLRVADFLIAQTRRQPAHQPD
ncbi:thiol:disulfide interchange protein DsbA/DsbL [Candidatus Symbiobacter mobilis]|uniref:Thiol:disulfide interchange protein n=1 Tax=Candidatus Symbiobacter mobilis CR TaxID=946483 RepID=U5N6B8_9BURK|nr:thiol:disulfide interchange protein DsbA/DsbL [Candidatus Symbiobacter mobilis]AGX86902.1 thiol:disulfide interchange protein DsbA [Candidatus Symbiobacter mobilis CR]